MFCTNCKTTVVESFFTTPAQKVGYLFSKHEVKNEEGKLNGIS